MRQLVWALAPLGLLLVGAAVVGLPDAARAQSGCEGVCPDPGEPPPPPPDLPPPPEPPVAPLPPDLPPETPPEVQPDSVTTDFGPDFSPEVLGGSVVEPGVVTLGGERLAGVPATTERASPEVTARIAAQARDAFDFCAALVSREYVVDCLSERLEEVAASIPQAGDYAPMRQAIETASQRLEAVVERYPSRDMPAGVARSTGPCRGRDQPPAPPGRDRRGGDRDRRGQRHHRRDGGGPAAHGGSGYRRGAGGRLRDRVGDPRDRSGAAAHDLKPALGRDVTPAEPVARGRPGCAVMMRQAFLPPSRKGRPNLDGGPTDPARRGNALRPARCPPGSAWRRPEGWRSGPACPPHCRPHRTRASRSWC